MELKKMEVTAIMLNGKAVEAYSIQTANEAYKLPLSFGDYPRRGYFTTVAQDGKDVKHYLPKDKFEEEILRFDPEILPKIKRGRPALEDRIIVIEQTVKKIHEILCASASLR